jgi:hypothetical protein
LPTQSASTWQPFPGPHFAAQAAPQSTSGSSPFSTPSTQFGTMQTCGLPAQTPLSQSEGTLQSRPSSHGGQSAPPQSISVSEPSLMVSMHVRRTHSFFRQTSPVHWLSSRHSTHEPFPSHSFPPPSVQSMPTALAMFTGKPWLQASTEHPFESSRTSVASATVTTEPPTQTLFLQSPGFCVAVGVLSRRLNAVHSPSRQAASTQSFSGSGSGQSMPREQEPPAPDVPPLPPWPA